MSNYRIIMIEDRANEPGDLYRRAAELKEKSPHINWIVGEERILMSDKEYETRVCVKVPKFQYEGEKTGPTEELKGVKIKQKASEWIKERILYDRILVRREYSSYEDSFVDPLGLPLDPNIFTFNMMNFDSVPDVFIQPKEAGIQLGYINTGWNGPHQPIAKLKIRNTLIWETLDPLSDNEKENLLTEQFLKTIESRKRQYKTCQFCGDKIPPGHLFNKKTCHSCATEFFGVIY